ncbi:MAG TPA: phosphatidylglycerophosphatase A [Terriglobales bacterium]|nr:phosphatidylglycerophosphatase A [Terriglobales bacterium]
MKTEMADPLVVPQGVRAPLWATFTATFLGVGRLRPGPGTWASLAATLIWYGLSYKVSLHAQASVLGVLALTAVVFGIPAATRVATASGVKDPQYVVIDEVAGQWITYLFVPLSWKTLLAGFILFRGFDIVKPPPVRQLEKLPGGTGIMFDDVAAGLLALIVMQLLLHFGLLSGRLS